MVLSRVKTANTGTPECAEAQFVLLAALGSDGKPYAMAVDEGSGELPVTLSGVSTVTIKETAFLNYATTNVTVAAWVELIAATSGILKTWDIFSGTGETLELGVGALGAETRFAFIPPGGGAPITHQLAAGVRVSIRAATATADAGFLTINAWS